MTENTPAVTREGVQGLQPSITYMRDGEPETITMTMGLLNKLLQRVGNYDNVSLVGMDPFFNEITLKVLLTKRDIKGRALNADGAYINPDKTRVGEIEDIADVDISPDDAGALLLFAQAHMVDFTFRAVMSASQLHQKAAQARDKVAAIAHGLIGSQNSISKTPAA